MCQCPHAVPSQASALGFLWICGARLFCVAPIRLFSEGPSGCRLRIHHRGNLSLIGSSSPHFCGVNRVRLNHPQQRLFFSANNDLSSHCKCRPGSFYGKRTAHEATEIFIQAEAGVLCVLRVHFRLCASQECDENFVCSLGDRNRTGNCSAALSILIGSHTWTASAKTDVRVLIYMNSTSEAMHDTDVHTRVPMYVCRRPDLNYVIQNRSTQPVVKISRFINVP